MVHWSWDGGLSNLASRCVHIQPILLLRSAQHGPDCTCPRIRVLLVLETTRSRRTHKESRDYSPLQIQTTLRSFKETVPSPTQDLPVLSSMRKY